MEENKVIWINVIDNPPKKGERVLVDDEGLNFGNWTGKYVTRDGVKIVGRFDDEQDEQPGEWHSKYYARIDNINAPQ